MHLAELRAENFRIFGEGADALKLPLTAGLTALVGENDSGKSAVVDALRLALGTSDQEWFRVEDSDFHEGGASTIRITCRFEGLSESDKRAFAEFLTYKTDGSGDVELHVNVSIEDTGKTRHGRPQRQVEVKSGLNAAGPRIPQESRNLLRATYLRPLRDAEQAMTAGRGSRLSQVLQCSAEVRNAGTDYDPNAPVEPDELSVLGIGDFADALLEKQQGVVDAKTAIDVHLAELALAGEEVSAGIGVGGAGASKEVRLKHLLEKLDLGLGGPGRQGLGANNRLFIACEMLLLSQEEGCRLLLIEEPEAHLDTQRQLQLVKSIQAQAEREHVQVILTTHSPNLASMIDLNRMVMIRGGYAFPLASGRTELEPVDYRFLQRFLDVTKANLFFARGVAVVEGDGENILLPTLASLIGCDFSKHGVSVVNVGGVGLRRYARVFQRRTTELDPTPREMDIPVACITDMDVAPNCAPALLDRNLKTKGELGVDGLVSRRAQLIAKASGQCVRTFVSDEWTLEYDLAMAGLDRDLFVAAQLARKEAALADAQYAAVVEDAESKHAEILSTAEELVESGNAQGCSRQEVAASLVYEQFAVQNVSKAATAQYLADRLRSRIEDGDLTPQALRQRLPKYLVEAIEYVTSSAPVGAEDEQLAADA